MIRAKIGVTFAFVYCYELPISAGAQQADVIGRRSCLAVGRELKVDHLAYLTVWVSTYSGATTLLWSTPLLLDTADFYVRLWLLLLLQVI